MNHKLAKALACCLLLAGTAASAQEPAQNIDPARHGNLAAAQDMVREAYDKVSVAQFDNNSQLGGHAAHAKELMREANDEIKMAAIVANGGVAPPVPVYVAPPSVAYVGPTYTLPGPGYVWAYHPRYGWGWHHPAWGWRAGWY
jgi:hypothetical protein